MLATFHPSSSPIWPATGLAIAALLILGKNYWPAIFVGAFIVNDTTAGTVLTSLGIGLGNTAEALLAVLLIQQIAGGRRTFHTVHGVLRFTLAIIPAAIVSATVGVLSLYLGGFVSRIGVPMTWFTWICGDTVGGITVVPLMVLWWDEASTFRKFSNARLLEAGTLCLFTVSLALTIFGNPFWHQRIQFPFAYLALIPILWAALRFGARQTMSMTFLVGAIALYSTLHNMGPFSVSANENTALLYLESFVAVATLMGLTLAAALRERRVTEELLEEKIEERTIELATAREHDRANLHRLRDMINRMTLATIAADEQLRIIHANELFCSYFYPTLSPEQIAGKSLPEILKSSYAPAQPFLRHFEDHTHVLGEEIQLQDGTILTYDYIPMRERGANRGHLIVCRDVTESKRVDRVKSEFVSLASHQLRTPLTKIRWSVGRLRKMPTLTTEQDELLRTTHASAEVMAQTINVMLTIAQMEAGKLEPRAGQIHLYHFLEILRKECSDEWGERGQTVQIHCPLDLTLSSDRLLLHEILINLFHNALKYTPHGGTVVMRAFPEGQKTCVEVEDTGIGIPPGDQGRIFEKFFRSGNALAVDQSGIGLGLYLVQMATRLLGAEVTFRSEQGRGTLFRLSFPPPVISPASGVAVSPSVSQMSLGLEVGARK